MRALVHSLIITISTMVQVNPAQAAMPLPRIDTTDRATVIASFVAEFNRAEPNPGWTGNVKSCKAGTTTDAFQMSVLQRVNWYRELAGLPELTLDTTKTAYAQAGALISAANRVLTHTPAATRTCYTEGGYKGTSSSNLALGQYGLSAINAYISDFGNNNSRVGHRRWILYPMLGSVATGDIPTGMQANALFVFTEPISRVTPRDGAVAWPPAGYVPYGVVSPRWSYDRYGADFTNAQVTVTGTTGAVRTTIVDRNGFIDPGIVFQPRYLNPTVNSDVTYTVNITGIGGTGDSSISYSVTLVRGNRPPASSLGNAEYTVKRGERLALARISSGIKSKKTYSATGGCRIDRTAMVVTTPPHGASCYVVIQYARNGSLRTRSVRITVT